MKIPLTQETWRPSELPVPRVGSQWKDLARERVRGFAATRNKYVCFL